MTRWSASVRFVRLLHGKRVRGLRQVDITGTSDQEHRRLTTLRKAAGRDRTRIINVFRHMLRRHNLQWHLTTKTFPTKRAITWLQRLVLSEIDRFSRCDDDRNESDQVTSNL